MAKAPVPEKKVNVLGALFDLIILILLCAGSAYGGYWYANKQRPPEAAPAPAKVEAATPQILPPIPKQVKPAVSTETKETKESNPAKETKETKETKSPAEESTETKAEEKAETKTSDKNAKKPGAKKFWLASSGQDYTGYSITVSVNGTPVDNFFGPGKMVDVTRYVKSGDNSVLFNAKELGEQYNKHKDELSAVLTVKLVNGPQIQENYKPADVLLTYSRTAAESEDFNDTKHFQKK